MCSLLLSLFFFIRSQSLHIKTGGYNTMAAASLPGHSAPSAGGERLPEPVEVGHEEGWHWDNARSESCLLLLLCLCCACLALSLSLSLSISLSFLPCSFTSCLFFSLSLSPSLRRSSSPLSCVSLFLCMPLSLFVHAPLSFAMHVMLYCRWGCKPWSPHRGPRISWSSPPTSCPLGPAAGGWGASQYLRAACSCDYHWGSGVPTLHATSMISGPWNAFSSCYMILTNYWHERERRGCIQQ